MSRKFLFIGLVAAALLAAFVVFRIFSRNPTGPGPQPVARDNRGAPLPVYVHQVTPQTLQERINVTGTLTADESVELVSEVSGKIVSVAFREGARVARGDVLIKIDDTELRAQLDRAASRVQLARVQAERQRQLVEVAGTTRESYDAAVNEVKVLEAEAELIRAQLAKTELRAPFDGLIGLRYVSEGAYVTPSTRIASLQKIDTIKVEFSVSERHLDRLQPEAQVRISIAGLPDSFVGSVYAIEPRIDVATRTLRLRARAENPGGKALPGGFATVEMPLREIPHALMVPANALIPGLNEQQLYIIEAGRAQPRAVQIGLRLAREIQIVSGLEAGATVITSGQLQLRPGMAVRPVEQADSTASTANLAVAP